jgi:hypothetical protein
MLVFKQLFAFSKHPVPLTANYSCCTVLYSGTSRIYDIFRTLPPHSSYHLLYLILTVYLRQISVWIKAHILHKMYMPLFIIHEVKRLIRPFRKCHDNQQNGTLHNNIQHNGQLWHSALMTLSGITICMTLESRIFLLLYWLL